MQGLLPIIRRKRRPLLVADAPPVVGADVEPVNPPLEAAQARELVATTEPIPVPASLNPDEQND